MFIYRRAIAALVNREPRPAALIRNEHYELYNSLLWNFFWIIVMCVAPTPALADIRSPPAPPNETVHQRHFVALLGWRI
jgi:hypothetical protein